MERWLTIFSFSALGLAGCGSSDGGGREEPEPIVFDMGTGGSSSTNVTIGPDGLPVGYTEADVGAWRLGQPFDGEAAENAPGANGCQSVLGVMRDFRDGSEQDGHPDFETYTGDGLDGIVEATLGSDRKPVYAHDGSTIYTTSPADFDQWYRNVDGVNQAFLINFWLEPMQPIFTFESTAFFPLDGAGWGNQGNEHNYHFTTEVHTSFRYNGGETFRFIGDDDLWVFINNRLAIDLGGLHPQQEDEVSLDDAASNLGIEVGGTYPLDLFHAERHTEFSNFRIDTNLDFVDCGTLVTDIR